MWRRRSTFVRRIKRVNPDVEIVVQTYVPMPQQNGAYGGVEMAFPSTPDGWITPHWYAYLIRTDPQLPWLPPRVRQRIRDFETVINSRWPTTQDMRLPAWGRAVLSNRSAVGAICWARTISRRSCASRRNWSGCANRGWRVYDAEHQRTWRRLQSAGSRLISTRPAETSLGAAGKSACATSCRRMRYGAARVSKRVSLFDAPRRSKKSRRAELQGRARQQASIAVRRTRSLTVAAP